MNKVLGISIIFLLFASTSFADVYIIYDTASGDIYSVSEKDDTVIPEGMKLETLAGSIKGLGLVQNPVYYKFIDEDFILNSEKINEEYQAKIDREKEQEEKALIKAKVEELAYDALVAEGVKFEKITKESFTKETK